MLSPVNLPPGKGEWSFRMPQSTAVMAIPIVEHWKKTGVKTYGFLGYSDAYGEAWLTDIRPLAEKAGIKLVATERFARPDTSVTGQALKLVSANPDAILVVASGSGAAMPHKGLVERGYAKAKIYQTHGAATMDLIRVGGADVEGSYVSSGPPWSRTCCRKAMPARRWGQIHHRVREGLWQGQREPVRRACVRRRDRARESRAAGAEEGQAGTKEFRAALKDALETMGRTPVSQGVLNYTPTDHFGYTPETGVLLKIVGGDWQVVPN
jgi:branched-chain amino acid transport system substrate-binding protein